MSRLVCCLAWRLGSNNLEGSRISRYQCRKKEICYKSSVTPQKENTLASLRFTGRLEHRIQQGDFAIWLSVIELCKIKDRNLKINQLEGLLLIISFITKFQLPQNATLICKPLCSCQKCLSLIKFLEGACMYCSLCLDLRNIVTWPGKRWYRSYLQFCNGFQKLPNIYLPNSKLTQ